MSDNLHGSTAAVPPPSYIDEDLWRARALVAEARIEELENDLKINAHLLAEATDRAMSAETQVAMLEKMLGVSAAQFKAARDRAETLEEHVAVLEKALLDLKVCFHESSGRERSLLMGIDLYGYHTETEDDLRNRAITAESRAAWLERALNDVLGHVQPSPDGSVTWIEDTDGRLMRANPSLACHLMAAYVALGKAVPGEKCVGGDEGTGE